MRELTLGVDIGGTNTRLAAIDRSGRIRRRVSFATLPSIEPRALVRNLAGAFGALGGRRDLGCAGVGVPSPLDTRRRIMRRAVNMPRFRAVPFAGMLERALGIPVALENDANVAAYGEYVRGAGGGRGSMVALTLGTGVGGGIVLNGALVTGDHGYGGELGHTKVDMEGRRCGCGRRGCLEAYAGARSMTSMAREVGLAVSGAEEIFALARRGNRACRAIVSEMARALGAAVASIAASLDPSRIVLAGGVSRAGRSLLSAVRREARRRMFPGLFLATRIVLGRLGDDAGLIGAALWARRRASA
jgi:glucokinase